ncbi:MAG: 7TM diverse intracellular signaling domain-containing protein [Oligoflexus sp.]
MKIIFKFSLTLILLLANQMMQAQEQTQNAGQVLEFQDLVLQESMEKIPVGRFLGFLIDNERSISIENITDDSSNVKFQRSESDTLTWGFLDKPIWIRLTIRNPFSVSKEIILESRYAPTDRVQLFIPNADGWDSALLAGDHVPSKEKQLDHRYPAFKFLAPPGRTTIYIKVETSSSANCFFYLWSANEFRTNQILEYIYLGVMLGALLVMAGYNLFLYFSFKSVVYIYYVGFILSFIAFQLSNQGLAAQYIFADSAVNWLSNDGFIVTGEMSYFFAALFASSFLNLKERAPRLDLACRIICFVSIFNILFLLVFGYKLAIKLTTINVFFASFVLLLSGIYCSYKKDKPARIYTLAWITILVGNTAIALRAGGLIADSFIAEWATLLGGALEGVLLSLALGYRINLIRFEYTKNIKVLNRQLEDQIHNVEGIVAEKTSDLEKAYDKLKTLDKQKTSFFQNISHELRTPLTLILNTQDRVLDRYPDDKDLQVAKRNTNRLYRLVNQFLDFQKLSTTKRDSVTQPIDLVKFMRHIQSYLGMSHAQISNKLRITCDGKELDVNRHAPSVFIRADIDALEKIAFNYLSNALKYGLPNTPIDLGVQVTNNKARLLVRDQGPGIAKSDIQNLFEVFSQLDGSATREHEGSGLGLALVKELAHRMDGEVGVESELGKGSTFWVDLPLMSDASTEQVKDSSEDLLIKDWLLDELMSYEEKDIDWDSETLVKSELCETILVIDDLRDMRMLIGSTLQQFGYQIIYASHGAEGLEKAKEKRPNLIVVDWMMPKMSGPEFIKLIRMDKEISGIPIVLLTAKADESSKLEGVQIGADSFLGKPFDKLELSSTVGNLLRLKEGEQKIAELNRHLTENVLKRFLPPKIVDEIVSGSMEFDKAPDLKVVTVMFVDLCGFTQMSENLGPRVTARILNEYLEAMSTLIFKHGGIVDKFIGDGIMAIFGAPVPVPQNDQIKAAMACAMEMQGMLDELNLNWAADKTPAMDMRIGIHHGPVVIGSFGGKNRSEYTAIGPVVNFASRIESVALPGQVYFSAVVRDYLEDEIWENAGTFELKGLSGKHNLYRIKKECVKMAS